MTTSAFARCWFLRVGFLRMPRSAVRAAVGSATIRYRPALARRYVLGLEGHSEGWLLGEIAIMDRRPGRTQAVRQGPRPGHRPGGWPVRCGDTGGPRGARPARRPPPDRGTAALDVERIPVSPKPITIDGERLDPIKHVQAWRERETTPMTELWLSVHAGLRAALAAVLDGAGRWQTKAVRLNALGIGTGRGGLWTAENVRKLARQLPPGEVRG